MKTFVALAVLSVVLLTAAASAFANEPGHEGLKLDEPAYVPAVRVERTGYTSSGSEDFDMIRPAVWDR